MSGNNVVIVGGGFAGLSAARALRSAPVNVTVVDRRNDHLFQPLLYQVATGSLSDGEIAAPLRGILGRQRNTRVLLGERVDLDLITKCVQLPTLHRSSTTRSWSRSAHKRRLSGTTRGRNERED
jgi:NADH dehydrogenase